MPLTYVKGLLWTYKAPSEDHFFGFAPAYETRKALRPTCPEQSQDYQLRQKLVTR